MYYNEVPVFMRNGYTFKGDNSDKKVLLPF